MKNFLLRYKIYATVLIVSMVATNASSQLRIGIKGSTPTLSSKESSRTYFEPVNHSEYNLTYLSTRTSYGLGLSLYQEKEKVFVMADLMYKATSSEFQLKMEDSLARQSANVFDRHDILSIPIVAGYRKNNFKVGLGPVFNIKLQSEYGLEGYEGFNLRERKLNKGVQFLIGYEIKDHIQIDLRHEVSLGSEGDDYNIVGNPLKIHSHPQSFSVSVGIFL